MADRLIRCRNAPQIAQATHLLFTTYAEYTDHWLHQRQGQRWVRDEPCYLLATDDPDII